MGLFTLSFMADGVYKCGTVSQCFASPSHSSIISWCVYGRSCLCMQTYLLRSVTYPIALLIVYSRHHLWPSLLRLTRRSFSWCMYSRGDVCASTDVSPTFHHMPYIALDRRLTSSFMAFASPSVRRSFHGVSMAGVVCACGRISYFP